LSGQQFRFVKDPYLNHAVMNAFEDILPSDSFPFYVLCIDIDPAKIDINVHPTKTEIKYEDEKSIYAILRSAVKRSLGRYNIAPTLDFNQETSFNHMISQKPLDEIQAPTITFNPSFNPFESEGGSSTRTSTRSADYAMGFEKKTAIPQNWDTLYQITEQDNAAQQLPLLPTEEQETAEQEEIKTSVVKQPFQLHNRYVVSQIHSGFMLIDQQAAHERILYEQFVEHLERQQGLSQQSLFPQTIELSNSDAALMQEILPDIQSLGFQLRPFGKTTYIVDGIPADVGNHLNETTVIEQLLEDFKNNKDELKMSKRENLAKSLARSAALKTGTALDHASMADLIDKLFACAVPNISLQGKPIIITFTLQELAERFAKTL